MHGLYKPSPVMVGLLWFIGLPTYVDPHPGPIAADVRKELRVKNSFKDAIGIQDHQMGMVC